MPRVSLRLRSPLDYKPLGLELVVAREAMNLTQRAVSFQTGISPSQISRIENGEGLDRISFEDIILLCRFYNLSPGFVAEKLGIGPAPEVTAVETDPRLQSLIGMMASMTPQMKDTFLDITCKLAATCAAMSTSKQEN